MTPEQFGRELWLACFLVALVDPLWPEWPRDARLARAGWDGNYERLSRDKGIAYAGVPVEDCCP